MALAIRHARAFAQHFNPMNLNPANMCSKRMFAIFSNGISFGDGKRPFKPMGLRGKAHSLPDEMSLRPAHVLPYEVLLEKVDSILKHKGINPGTPISKNDLSYVLRLLSFSKDVFKGIKAINLTNREILEAVALGQIERAPISTLLSLHRYQLAEVEGLDSNEECPENLLPEYLKAAYTQDPSFFKAAYLKAAEKIALTPPHACEYGQFLSLSQALFSMLPITDCENLCQGVQDLSSKAFDDLFSRYVNSGIPERQSKEDYKGSCYLFTDLLGILNDRKIKADLAS